MKLRVASSAPSYVLTQSTEIFMSVMFVVKDVHAAVLHRTGPNLAQWLTLQRAWSPLITPKLWLFHAHTDISFLVPDFNICLTVARLITQRIKSAWQLSPSITFWNVHFDLMTLSNGNIFRVTGPLWEKSPVNGEFPTKRPVTRSFDDFFDLRLNKRLSKQWWGWWYETPSRPLWRHYNGKIR